MLCLNPVSQEKIIHHYIPKKLIPASWTYDQEFDLSGLISGGNNALRLFANEEELIDELNSYTQLPGSFKLFGIDDPEDIFMNKGPIFKSLKNKEYTYIGHYFYNFDLLGTIFLNGLVTKLVYETIVLYLKRLFSRVKNHSELVPYENSRIETLCQIFMNFKDRLKEENQESISDSKNFTRKCFKTFREAGSEGFEAEFQKILKRSLQSLPIKRNGKAYYKMYASIDFVIRKFDELYKCLVSELKASKPVIRLFHLDDYHVLVHEVHHTLKQKSCYAPQELPEDLPKTTIANFKTIAEVWGTEVMKTIEFVKVPIPNFKFSVAIMPSFDGGYIILTRKAVDHIMTHMILVDKVFQMMTPDQFTLIEQFYESTKKKYGKLNFIDYPTFELMKQEWNQYFETHFNNTAMDRKEIRNVDETREFTLEDLKEELKYLGLTEVFPKILNHSEKVFSALGDQKTEKRNTKDFIHTIYVCQNDCASERLAHIFRSTGGRVADSASTESDDGDSNNSTRDSIDDEEIDEIREEHCGIEPTTDCGEAIDDSIGSGLIIENTNEAVTENLENEEDDAPASTKTTGFEPSESSDDSSPFKKIDPAPSKSASTEAPQKKKRVKQPKIPSQKPENVKPAAMESNACGKCFKSSESFRVANAKLKQSKEETKQMRKDLANSELEAEQLKEVVRMLREKLHQKDIQLYDLAQDKERLEQELSEKNTIIEVMQAEAVVHKDPTPVQLVPTVTVAEDAKDALLKLLSIRNTIQIENPIEQSTTIFNDVIGKSKDEEIKEMTKTEMEAYHEKCEAYENTVETQINQILATPTYTDDPNLPEFPEFSEKFQVVHKKVMKSETPKICESLRSNLDCTICLLFMSNSLKTIKCGRCKNSCHHKCATKWFKQGSRSCPSCRLPMYDEKEFPSLF